jgi:prevent-host-death family protein
MAHLPASEARDKFSDTLNRAAYGGERIVLQRRGKNIAALIPMEDYELFLRLVREREDRDDSEALQRAKQESGSISWEEIKREAGLA